MQPETITSVEHDHVLSGGAKFNSNLRDNFEGIAAIVECNDLVRAEGQLSVGSPFIITEFNLVNFRRQYFHDRPDLPPLKFPLWYVLHQCNCIEQFDFPFLH